MLRGMRAYLSKIREKIKITHQYNIEEDVKASTRLLASSFLFYP